MLTCKDVSKLVSESFDRELSIRQRVGVQFHLMMCSLCRTFQKQTLQLREVMRTCARRAPPAQLSKEAGQRIKNALKTDEK